MPITIGRLAIEAPISFPEEIGEAIGRVGATPVPQTRSGLTISAGLETHPASGASNAADRERIRRQIRAMVSNLPLTLTALEVVYDDDAEQSGFYAIGRSTIDGFLPTSYWTFTLPLALVGRRRTHRRAVGAHVLDRRLSTTPRDTLRRIFSTSFSGLTALAILWLPSNATDELVTASAAVTRTGPRVGHGSSSIAGLVAISDLAVVSLEQVEPARNRGDVVLLDRRGVLTAPATADAAWEEVYGADWPLSAADVPVLENSLCRVRWDPANADGFALDMWTGSAWTEQGKILLERIGATTGVLDVLVSADVREWSPERAVVHVVMRRAADALSREDVFLTLQRGWTGPRVEVYPAPLAAGTPAGAGVHFYGAVAPGNPEQAQKDDTAGIVTVSVSGNFTPGNVGATTFNDQNWLAYLPATAGRAQVTLAVLQSAAAGRVENSADAYGAARNGIAVELAAAGYICAHLGQIVHAGAFILADQTAGTGQYNGARDLGQSALFDTQARPTLVAR